MTSFQNLSQSERESILDRIRDVSDDSIDLIKDNNPASPTTLWSSEKIIQEVSLIPAVVYSVALGGI